MLETALTPNPTQIVLFRAPQKTERMLMTTPVNTLKGAEKILVAISEFNYLTAEQATRLLYKESSLAFVRKKLRALVKQNYVLALGGRAVNLPLVYTLTSRGRAYVGLLGEESRKRIRPSEEKEKSENLFFMKHTLAVTDVLIAGRCLAKQYRGYAHPHVC
jgi:protein involved in plasmid replication-relaxation